MDSHSEGSLMVDNYPRRWTSSRDIPPHIRRRRRRRQLVTLGMLPYEVLLEIFDFCVDENFDPLDPQRIEKWITLAHVCRRWRSVVFHSPRRLNLRILCTHKTPARDTLDIWPPLPLIVHHTADDEPRGMDNIIAALEHNDRVCHIHLGLGGLTGSELECVTGSAAMHQHFPELTHLGLYEHDEYAADGPGPTLPKPILDDSFLGGNAPRLRSLLLYDVPFPGLPILLLSTTHLVNLDLGFIPRAGYIPPEVMATCLSALTNLRFLRLHFQYPSPRPQPRPRPRPRPALEGLPRPPPPTRSILPSLIVFLFKGVSEYLEEILAQIDFPQLHKLRITFFNQIIFHTPQLLEFISRTPTLRAPEKGYIAFNSKGIIVKFPSQTSDYDALSLQIPCTTSEWQLSSLEQVCTSFLPPLSALEDLYILEHSISRPCWQDDIENTLWLEVLRPFAAVKNFYLSEGLRARIAPALQELVGEGTTEVLPTLENIFLEGFRPLGPLCDGIEKFVAARWLTSHPIAVSRWDSWGFYEW